MCFIAEDITGEKPKPKVIRLRKVIAIRRKKK